MWEYIEERVISEARYIIGKGATVRGAAKEFGISKSTIHNDMTVRLKEIDEELYHKVRKVTEKNLSERHIRGGLATRKKYRERSAHFTKL
jgi:putative DeoR family transcriptional regulator (stage III sporulation protein D)